MCPNFLNLDPFSDLCKLNDMQIVHEALVKFICSFHLIEQDKRKNGINFVQLISFIQPEISSLKLCVVQSTGLTDWLVVQIPDVVYLNEAYPSITVLFPSNEVAQLHLESCRKSYCKKVRICLCKRGGDGKLDIYLTMDLSCLLREFLSLN